MTNDTSHIRIREAGEEDVGAIGELFHTAYGDEYAFPRFYEPRFLKSLVFNNDCLMLVAEDTVTGKIIGTGSVVFDVGAFTDLVGEFGRLVVHPDGRGQGLGDKLMEERLSRVGNHLHVGLADNRVAHPFSQKISLRHGFQPIGYLPIHNGEPVALFARHFNDSLELRRNHPHIAPGIHWIAHACCESLGMDCDVIIDESSPSYPDDNNFEVEEMSSRGYASLLRFERGRFRQRDIFGPVKVHFGIRALERHQTSYLLAKREGRLVGAVGYARDTNIDNAVRIFELIHLNEDPVRFLLAELERRCREEWQVDYIETDVNADSPRMQKTLLELGFLPVAYLPSAVFHYTERLDTVRMARYFVPVSDTGDALVDTMKPIADGVVSRFQRQWIEPVLSENLHRTKVFAGLNTEQQARLANLFRQVQFAPGDSIVTENQTDGKAYIITGGSAGVEVKESGACGQLGEGDFIGELSLLNHAPHSADVRADGHVEAAQINHRDLEELLRKRGDIGLILYRNLARGLGEKLQRTGDGNHEG